MAKHTPGPWHLAGDAEGTMITDDKGAHIAMWPPQGGTVEQCANARIIAAAPDLLAALEALNAAVIRAGYGNTAMPELSQAWAAIHRATGR